jgi:hypothetical protein
MGPEPGPGIRRRRPARSRGEPPHRRRLQCKRELVGREDLRGSDRERGYGRRGCSCRSATERRLQVTRKSWVRGRLHVRFCVRIGVRFIIGSLSVLYANRTWNRTGIRTRVDGPLEWKTYF